MAGMPSPRATTGANRARVLGVRFASGLDEACERWAERPAITFAGHTITYRELGERVGKLAAAYRELGVRAGDRVLCQLPNTPDHVVAVGAAWACGAVHAGTDNDLTGPELAALALRLQPAALVFSPRPGAPDPLGPLRAVRQACPTTTLIVSGAPAEEEGQLSLDELLASPKPSPGLWPAPFGPDDAAVLHLTSGTTGRPKAVMESMPHCWAKMQFFADAFWPDPDDVHLLYLPMGHVFGLRLALIPLLTGGRLVLLDRFSPRVALSLVAQERVSVLPGMPTHLNLIVDQLQGGGHDVSSLRWVISAAAALPEPLFRRVRQELGVEMLFVYGCSEGFTTLTTDPDEIASGSVGREVFRAPPGNAPNGTVAVVHPVDHRPLPPGEVGEIVFGADRPVRYWDEPPVATDGWYHTGDLGRIDADGRVYVLGRLKELVNRGGLKVSPTEIEVVVARHPQVADAAIVGTPDPVLGEAICACVVPADGALPTLGELRAFLGECLARHKLPDELSVVPAIPRTKIGKVDRGALVATIVENDLVVERLRPR